MYLLNRKNIQFTIIFISILAYWLMVTTSISNHGMGNAISNNPYVLYGVLFGAPLFVALKVQKYKALRLCALLVLLLLWIAAFMPLVNTIKG